MLYLDLLKQARLLQVDELDLNTKTRVFSLAFSGLSSKLEIVAHLSTLILKQFMSVYGVICVDQLLDLDNAYFFNNLFAKLRYFSSSMSPKHIELALTSLKDHAP